MLDGNRRWAKARGAGTKEGHQAGADNIANFLAWCEDAGVEVVTLWLLSTDNLNRPAAELAPLLTIIENTVADLAETRRWRINPVGSPDLLPAETARKAQGDADATAGVKGMVVNVAVGYGGRGDHRRGALPARRARRQRHEHRGARGEPAGRAHRRAPLHQRPSRTPTSSSARRGSSGSRILWQSAHSEFYFCEAYWPDFRIVGLRALRVLGAPPPVRVLRPPHTGRLSALPSPSCRRAESAEQPKSR